MGLKVVGGGGVRTSGPCGNRRLCHQATFCVILFPVSVNEKSAGYSIKSPPISTFRLLTLWTLPVIEPYGEQSERLPGYAQLHDDDDDDDEVNEKWRLRSSAGRPRAHAIEYRQQPPAVNIGWIVRSAGSPAARSSKSRASSVTLAFW